MFFFTVEYLRKMRIFTLIYSKLNIHEREMKSLICLSALLLFACTSIPIQSNLTDETRKVIDSLIRVTPGIDSLAILLDNYTGDENKYGMMRASSELGKRYRETAKFNEAVVCHRQALGLAEQLGDTVEIIQICNQIGTNFRRMGIMDEASTYHYKALALCEQYHDKSSYAALKNRVISLNGIGKSSPSARPCPENSSWKATWVRRSIMPISEQSSKSRV